MTSDTPFQRPNPPKLSELLDDLRKVEASGIFTNYGPVNTSFEQQLTERLFGGQGGCVTVCNATIGLMLAIRRAARTTGSRPQYALMPSFTFAAAAQAALWAGLIPLLGDINEEDWSASAQAEDDLLRRYAGQITVVVPYATFGNPIDLIRYERRARKDGIGLVVDAAASLGSLDDCGRGFGTGLPHPVIFSMHATKTFATAEAGLIYCADETAITELRAMGNFGFGEPRTATMAGLNAKLSEIGALLGLAKLDTYEAAVVHRAALAKVYREELPSFTFQRSLGSRQAHQFLPALLPQAYAHRRGEIIKALAARGIAVAQYFSPHLAEHPYFKSTCVAGPLEITHKIASRIISLPLSDTLTAREVRHVAAALRELCP